VLITVNAAPPPATWKVAFTASVDHDTRVTNYLFEVFASGVDPSTTPPVAWSDLGKPAPASNREILVDRTALIEALAAGTYTTTVRAVGPGGSARSAPYVLTR
jgi:hypothetical protein